MPTATRHITTAPLARPVTLNAPTPNTDHTRVRGAEPGDEHDIAALIAAWSEQGLTLPRTAQQVVECIGEFAVAELNQHNHTRLIQIIRPHTSHATTPATIQHHTPYRATHSLNRCNTH